MPIYEYECSSCHHKFDLIQKIHDEPTKHCPECKKDTAIRLVSAAGFQLKGTGWYVTDFKNKGKPEQNKANKSTEEKSSSESKTPDSSSSSSSKKGEKD